jgi:hypothetical protein
MPNCHPPKHNKITYGVQHNDDTFPYAILANLLPTPIQKILLNTLLSETLNLCLGLKKSHLTTKKTVSKITFIKL